MSTPLPSEKNAEELLEMYYLDMRSALLETAAGLDRLERAEDYQKIAENPKYKRLFTAMKMILETRKYRSERFLELFSE